MDANDLMDVLGDDDPNLKSEMEKIMADKYPDENPELRETRADLAIDNARRYRQGN